MSEIVPRALARAAGGECLRTRRVLRPQRAGALRAKAGRLPEATRPTTDFRGEIPRRVPAWGQASAGPHRGLLRACRARTDQGITRPAHRNPGQGVGGAVVSDLPRSWPPGYPAHRALSLEEALRLDREAQEAYGIPSLVLMEHAARGVAAVAESLTPVGAGVLVLCGPGNNGGDGYGVARALRSWGRPTTVLRCSRNPPPGKDAALQHALADAPGGGVEPAWGIRWALARALAAGPALVVDALFGVGLSRPLSEPYLGWIEELNQAPCLRLALDLPSGMDTDLGGGLPVCVEAHVTAALAAPKRGLQLNPRAAGRVVEVDIGLPRELHGAYLAG